MAITKRSTAPATQGGSVNFGGDEFYAGGFGIPEGDYALEFHTQMVQPTSKSGAPTGSAFLAIVLTCHPLGGGEALEHSLGCGRKAHESFVPSADGKGFDAVPGGTVSGFNDMTNWALFRKSMRDCGLPTDLLQNDLRVLDGIHVHIQSVPEPESRKALRSQTGEASLQMGDDRPKFVPVVSEIKDDGKPWEGTGGIPDGTPVAKVNAKVAPKAIAKAKPAPAPVVEEDTEVSEEDLAVAAMNGITEHLSKPANAKGCAKLALRTGTFQAVAKAQGDDMAQAVVETYFASDEALNGILGDLGYVVQGGKVTVAS